MSEEERSEEERSDEPSNLAAVALLEGEIECMLICYLKKKTGNIVVDYDGGALSALGLAEFARDLIKADLRAAESDDA